MRDSLQPLLSLLTVLLILGPAYGQDRIDRVRGAPLAGVLVTKEDFRSVTYTRKGGQGIEVPASQVLDVVRGTMPASLREGKTKVMSGDLKNAVGILTLTVKDATDPWIKEYASFYLAEASRQLGKYDDAIRAYEAVLVAKPDTRFLPRVRLRIAGAHTASGKYSNAETVLKAFVKEVDSKRLPRYFALEGKQLLGRNLEAQKKYAEAARQYEGVISEAASLGSRATEETEKEAFKQVELRAQRDKGSALIKDKKYSEANRIFGRLAGTPGAGPVAKAIALMGQGEIDLAQGNADRARIRLSQAVALQFGADEEHPRALRLLAEAYLALKDKSEKGAGKMARIYLDDLIKRYPGSEDAKIARTLMQRL